MEKYDSDAINHRHKNNYNINRNAKRIIAVVVVIGIILVLSIGFEQISVSNTNAQNTSQSNLNTNNTAMDPIIMHIHPKITLTIDGNKEVIPMNIGMSSVLWKDHSLDKYGMQAMPEMAMSGMAPLHTHDDTGLIHVESTINRNYTLGEFLNIWGSLDINNRVVNMTVNGKPDSNGNFTNHILRDNEQINLDIIK
ncbi:MAG: hypothetical protein H0X03_00935 [Nitrosopumilus sp.]|nr:hypothetical protein [Nitrosopumilus sp.]